jgi:GTPase
MSEHTTAPGTRPTAVVVAVQLPGVSDGELASSIAELERLARTLGLDPVGRFTQRRGHLASGVVVGEGKLKELAAWTGGTGVVPVYEKPGRTARDAADDDGDADEADAPEADADDGEVGRHTAGDAGDEDPGEDAHRDAAIVATDADAAPRAHVVLVDHDLTPTQQRNLERATDAEVHDRSSIILSIFHRHARTREARLQVEIARLAYMAPRLREGGGGGDRVRGGVGGKGAGESSLELDRRRIRDRIAELRRELESLEGTAQVQRGRRGDLPTVALVGYTNAGKSSLMRALTGSEVHVADALFATLDTTVRPLAPRTDPPILVSDTVGFIKKLPHDLVASFRSTLAEAREADLLLQVVDASDAAFRDHMRVTGQVLAELGIDRPHWLLLNKIDRVAGDDRALLAAEQPDALQLSAHRPPDVAALRDRVVAHFLGAFAQAELLVPWTAHRVVHRIHQHCHVLAENHGPDGTRLLVRAPSTVIDALRAEIEG